MYYTAATRHAIIRLTICLRKIEVRMTDLWAGRYAARVQNMHSSIIREILKTTQRPDIISFAGGLPAPEIFPIQAVRDATERVLCEHGSEALQYAVTEGYPPLRDMIVRHMQRYGIHCNIDNVLITSGSQQALDLIGKVMIDDGDKVVVEEPTYMGALQAWNVYGADYAGVPADDDGMRTSGLDRALKADDAKFIYALPNFQNPSGSTLSYERRVSVVQLAEKYHMPIIEDDPYGQLRFEGEHITPLIALDAEMRGEGGAQDACMITGNVLYLSTFSKTLAPGLRVAWMVGPEDVIQKMVQAKQGADLHTSTFAQMVAFETARGGFLDDHVKVIRAVYRARRDLMLGLFQELMPEGVTWTKPLGGLFLWVRLPAVIDTEELLKAAISRKVAFVPGAAFFPRGGGNNTMRINFSNATEAQIEEGAKRLAMVVKEALGVLQPA
jgi:2-aminoadipate transaminase